MFHCSCGLAVLAMAMRPILICEVAEGGAAKCGSESINGTEKNDDLNSVMESTIKRGISKAVSQNNIWPQHYEPPTLMDLQDQVIRSSYSSMGEMFSSLAMAKIASLYQCGRYKVRLLNRPLIFGNEASENIHIGKNNMDSLYGQNANKHNDNNSKLSSENEKPPKNALRNTKIEDTRSNCNFDTGIMNNCSYNIPQHTDFSNECLSNTAKEKIPDYSNDISTDLHDDIPPVALSNPTSCPYKHELLTSKPGLSSWSVSVVERLMRGHLIAVW